MLQVSQELQGALPEGLQDDSMEFPLPQDVLIQEF
jgi:hypothetical protein